MILFFMYFFPPCRTAFTHAQICLNNILLDFLIHSFFFDYSRENPTIIWCNFRYKCVSRLLAYGRTTTYGDNTRKKNCTHKRIQGHSLQFFGHIHTSRLCHTHTIYHCNLHWSPPAFIWLSLFGAKFAKTQLEKLFLLGFWILQKLWKTEKNQ